MTVSRDSEIIELWLERQASPHTRSCYRRDVKRLLALLRKPLKAMTLSDLQQFAQQLVEDGLAPISRVRTLAAIESLFGFCQRMRYLPANAAAELALPCYEQRLAERIVGKEEVKRLVKTDAVIDDDPSPRASSNARRAVTVAFAKPGCGASRNHVRNSSSAVLYTRFVIGDDTESSTIAFNRSQFAGISTTAKSFIARPFSP